MDRYRSTTGTVLRRSATPEEAVTVETTEFSGDPLGEDTPQDFGFFAPPAEPGTEGVTEQDDQPAEGAADAAADGVGAPVAEPLSEAFDAGQYAVGAAAPMPPVAPQRGFAPGS